MKKTTRNILIMLAVLLVLGGAAAALFLTQPKTGEEDASSTPVSSAPAETVTDREITEVASISVENQESSFEMIPAESGAGDGSSSGDSVEFLLKGYEDYDVDRSAVTASATSLLSLTAAKSLGEQESLGDFGLSGDSAVDVTLKYQDGSSDQLVLGSKGGESAGRYVLKDGRVYIVSGIPENLFGSVFAYFNTDLYTIEDRMTTVVDDEGNETQQQAADMLEKASFSGTNFPQPIEIKRDDSKVSGYLITTPVTAESGSNAFNEMVEALKSLSASGVEAVGLTDSLLEEYGLSEPFARLEFTLNGDSHTMAVSEKNSDGERYLILDDSDVVYRVAAESVSTWAEATLMGLRMSYVWLPNITDVEKLELTVDGKDVYTYNATRTVNEEKSTETKTSYDLTVKNGAGMDTVYENYQHFYQYLIAVAVLSVDEADYSGTPALRVEYDYFEDKGADIVEFYPVGTDRYAAVVNGEFNGLVRKSELDQVISLVPALDAGETIEKSM